MKIIVKNTNSERQSPEVTIDTSTCHYPYAIREAFELALQLDGHTKETINEVFNQMPVVCKQDAGGQAEPAQEQGHFTNDIDGYWKALQWVEQTGNTEFRKLYQDDPNQFITKANELWEQDNLKQ